MGLTAWGSAHSDLPPPLPPPRPLFSHMCSAVQPPAARPGGAVCQVPGGRRLLRPRARLPTHLQRAQLPLPAEQHRRVAGRHHAHHVSGCASQQQPAKLEAWGPGTQLNHGDHCCYAAANFPCDPPPPQSSPIPTRSPLLTASNHRGGHAGGCGCATHDLDQCTSAELHLYWLPGTRRGDAAALHTHCSPHFCPLPDRLPAGHVWHCKCQAAQVCQVPGDECRGKGQGTG